MQNMRMTGAFDIVCKYPSFLSSFFGQKIFRIGEGAVQRQRLLCLKRREVTSIAVLRDKLCPPESKVICKYLIACVTRLIKPFFVLLFF